MQKKTLQLFGSASGQIFVGIMGLILIYPLIWLFFSSFKTNADLFGSLNLLPHTWVLDSYRLGWQASGQYTYTTFFLNTFYLVIPTVAATVVSSSLIAYGFARFQFPLKNLMFILMISTIMIPPSVVLIPRYLLFRDMGWLNTYLPFIIPALFGAYPFFIFMLVQFFRGIPRELDEAALIDGCNPFTIFLKILLPLCKPALFSAAIFQFIWTWNDFFNSLVYINSVNKYTISLALRMSIDTSATGGTVSWNQILAMAVVAVLPPTLLFFFAQRYFVEGIATSGIKG